MRYSNSSGPMTIMLDVTSKCNCRCLHCYNESGDGLEDELSDEELLNIANQINSLKPATVCLCGGETLVRKNIVLKLIKRLNDNVSSVNMVSNGFYLDYQTAKQLKAAGLGFLQISLDGNNQIEHDTFRQFVGAYESALTAISNAIKAGIPIAVSCIPNKMNYKHISRMIRKLYDMGVGQVRLMPLIPMGRGSKIESLLLSAEEYVELQYNLMCINNVEYAGMQYIEWGDPLDHYSRLPANKEIGYKTMQFEIKANGDVSISAYLPIVVGNIREHTIKEFWEMGYKNIWNSDYFGKYLEQIENIYDIAKIKSADGGKIVLPLY